MIEIITITSFIIIILYYLLVYKKQDKNKILFIKRHNELNKNMIDIKENNIELWRKLCIAEKRELNFYYYLYINYQEECRKHNINCFGFTTFVFLNKLDLI